VADESGAPPAHGSCHPWPQGGRADRHADRLHSAHGGAARPHCDLLLVGDSLAQVVYGLPTTLPVTLDMMIAHGAAVVRGSRNALVVVDMPFGSYEEGPEQAFHSAARVMQETGAGAIKLEGGVPMAPTIGYPTERGIPVMAHIGLTPQAVNVLGGYGARGLGNVENSRIMGDALAVDAAGSFSVVIEAVVEGLANERRDPLAVRVVRRVRSALPPGHASLRDPSNSAMRLCLISARRRKGSRALPMWGR
jgi:3-methyl-2-oxobutanoate hydroxymethyltransferase